VAIFVVLVMLLAYYSYLINYSIELYL